MRGPEPERAYRRPRPMLLVVAQRVPEIPRAGMR